MPPKKKVNKDARVKPRKRELYESLGEGVVIEAIGLKLWKVQFGNVFHSFKSAMLTVVENREPDPRAAPEPATPGARGDPPRQGTDISDDDEGLEKEEEIAPARRPFPAQPPRPAKASQPQDEGFAGRHSEGRPVQNSRPAVVTGSGTSSNAKAVQTLSASVLAPAQRMYCAATQGRPLQSSRPSTVAVAAATSNTDALQILSSDESSGDEEPGNTAPAQRKHPPQLAGQVAAATSNAEAQQILSSDESSGDEEPGNTTPAQRKHPPQPAGQENRSVQRPCPTIAATVRTTTSNVSSVDCLVNCLHGEVHAESGTEATEELGSTAPAQCEHPTQSAWQEDMPVRSPRPMTAATVAATTSAASSTDGLVDCLRGEVHAEPDEATEAFLYEMDEASEDEHQYYPDEESGDRRHRLLKEEAEREKSDLIEEGFTVEKRGRRGSSYTWKLVDRSVPAETVEDYEKIGIRGYEFDTTDEDKFPLSNVFLLLWPGIPKKQLKNMNRAIESHNYSRSYPVKINLVSEAEWWTYIGIMVVAGACRKGGAPLWATTSDTDSILPAPAIGISTCMSLTRFGQIRKFYVAGLAAYPPATDDPWYPIQHHMDEFNANRIKTVAASRYKTMDESMSAFRPRKTKNGNLPHLSFIFRKPEPLGTELKTVGCSKTKIMLHMEIQKGKTAMANSTFQQEYGATTACVVRMALATKWCGQKEEDRQRDIFIRDSWFASVNSTEQLFLRGMDFIGNCKTAHKFSPTKVSSAYVYVCSSIAVAAYGIVPEP